MKHIQLLKKLFIPVMATAMLAAVGFTSCSTSVYVLSIEKTESLSDKDIYTVTYSDGTKNQFSVSNGGSSSSSSVTVDDLYNKYVEEYGDISYSEFLEKYLGNFSSSSTESTAAINSAATTCVEVYSEFTKQTSTGMTRPGSSVNTSYSTAVYTGSGVIYKMYEEYTYIITNYHMVYYTYDISTDKISDNIHIYLYGSSDTPVGTGYNSDGTVKYDYGDYGISCTYVGGSINTDIAIIKAKTSDIKAISSLAHEAEFADSYHLGQTAYAVGNASGEGLTVTKGVVSVMDESIQLAIDNTARSYREMRTDAVYYEGSSGGGLFNEQGKLIGITNAGEGESEQAMNYSVPLEVAQNCADNILYYYLDGDSSTNEAYTLSLGLTLTESNLRSVYDSTSSYIYSKADICVKSVSGIAKSIGIEADDLLSTVKIDGKTYELRRSYNLGDALMTVRPGSSIEFTVLRDGRTITSSSYKVTLSDLKTL